MEVKARLKLITKVICLLGSLVHPQNLHQLEEIERVVKPNGYAIHLLTSPTKSETEPIHQTLTSLKWNYQFKEVDSNGEVKSKYWKHI